MRKSKLAEVDDLIRLQVQHHDDDDDDNDYMIAGIHPKYLRNEYL